MIKLVCFPHYTGGALVCNLLNDARFSGFNDSTGGLKSYQHNLGKINSSNTVQDSCSSTELMQQINLNSNRDPLKWIGTHCWPNKSIMSIASEVINITTETNKSKLYRWMRAYEHYFQNTKIWKSLEGADFVDKTRETAKNYLIPSKFVNGARNIEFADIVENNYSFREINTDTELYTRWKEQNSFLYNNVWEHPAVQSYYEAEYEVQTNTYYRYHL
jgi:hypothetical protein